jgi:hypothetical protein
MFQGCLEFQWHHEIPRDIVHKGLLSSCADLNVVVLANMIAVALVHGLPSTTTVMMMTNSMTSTNYDDNTTTTTTDKQNLLWSIMGLKLLYDMRRFGARLDKCETVACMAGSNNLMLGPLPDVRL